MLRLQVQRAQGTGIRISDTDIDQAVQRVADNNKIDVRTLRASLDRDGLNYDDFRKNLRDQLLVSRLQQRVAAPLHAIGTILHIEFRAVGGGDNLVH